MPSLRSSTLPKVDPEAWKGRFSGTNTRSTTQAQAYEYRSLGAYEFLSLVDAPPPSAKRVRSTAFESGFSQSHGRKEIIDLTNDDEELVHKKIPTPSHVDNASFQSPVPPETSKIHRHVPTAFPALFPLARSDGIIDVTQNRHIDQAESRAKLLTMPAEVSGTLNGLNSVIVASHLTIAFPISSTNSLLDSSKMMPTLLL